MSQKIKLTLFALALVPLMCVYSVINNVTIGQSLDQPSDQLNATTDVTTENNSNIIVD